MIEEAADQPPDVYGVKGKTQVTRGQARYAYRQLTKAIQALALKHVSAFFQPDYEVHHNVPDGNGGHKSIQTDTKTGTFSTYIEVRPQGEQ
jgi:hypothetical protein